MDAPVATKVAVVGLGKMGLAIAERVLAGGSPLAVHNRTPGRETELVAGGATVLGSAAGALRICDVCVTMLADDEALEAVVLGADGVLAGARAGTTLIDMSTVSVAVSERVADAADAAGVSFLRAPVSGNPVVVRSGKLTIMVSGPEDTARTFDGLLRAIGPTVFYVGDGERARVVKLVLQVLIGGTAELLAEGLLLGEAAGIDRAKLLEVIGASAAGSPFVGYKTEPLLRGDYSATFTTTMMLKDLDLVLDLASEADLELPFAEGLRPLLEETAEVGYADSDFMALLVRLERLVGRRAARGPT
jgi:3-hydroxyisobutyrate dehydrogenase-like beta-hydroxyacid dehydrogenase